MKEVELIQRYVHIRNPSTFAAGVYLGSLAMSLTTKFNLSLNSLQANIRFTDSVTGQALNGSVNIPLVFANDKADNPGFTSNYLYAPSITISSRAPNMFYFYNEVATNEQITINSVGNLETVTANIVNVALVLSIGYLCPKDYLNINAFAVNPR